MAALRQQIFNVAKAQGEPQIEPDCLLDDFGREPVAFVADFPHRLGYLTEGEAASSNRRDNALFSALSEPFPNYGFATRSNAYNLGPFKGRS